MNQLIKTDSVDFQDLISKNTKLSSNIQSKMIEKLNKNFTEDESRWYIANLYMYLNYDNTNDFPINLEIVVKIVGFAQKANAKRTLENNFTINEDYKIIKKSHIENTDKTIFIPTEENKTSTETRGRKEETIMLNVDTFKNLCMLVKSEKAKQIRKYYVKLENIYNNIVKEEIEEQKILQENTQKILEEKDIKHILNLKLNKHKILLEKFTNKTCIYLVEITEDLIKIGSSEDINIRKSNLKDVFGSCTFLDVFECSKSDFREIEQHILCKVKNYLYKQPINGHISKEVVKLNEQTFNYNQLKTIVTNQIKNFVNKELELRKIEFETKKIDFENKKIEFESKKIDLINSYLQHNFNYDQIYKILNIEIQQNKLQNEIKSETQNEIQNEIQTIIQNKTQNETQTEIHNEIEEVNLQETKIAKTIIRKGRKIQVINPDNLNVIVKIYDSMVFALRDSEQQYEKHSIQNAIKNNTIYKGYRWLYVEHAQHPQIIKDIQLTKHSNQPENNTIVQLNNKKTEIIEIFTGVTQIRTKFKVSLERFYKIINQQLLFNDSFFINIKDCPENLLEKTVIPIRSTTKSKKIKQINIVTNEEIIYKSMNDACIKFGTTHKTINTHIKNKKVYNNYKWEFI